MAHLFGSDRSADAIGTPRLAPIIVWALCAVLLVACAAGLRSLHPTADAPGYLDSSGFLVTDEGWYAARAAQQYLGMPVIEADLNTVPHTPLFHLWVRLAFAFFGVHLYSVRILNIVAACATVGILCCLDRSRPWLGLLAAALVAFDYNHIMFARIGGSEPLQVMFAALALVSFVRGHRRPWLQVTGMLAAVAAGLTKTNGFVLVGVCLLAEQMSLPFGWRNTSARDRLRAAALPALVACVCLAAWWVGWVSPHLTGFQAMSQHTVTARMPDSLAKLARNVAAFFIIPPLGPRSFLLLAPGVAGFVLALADLVRLRPLPRHVAFSTAWVILTGGMIAVYNYQPERYLLLLVPAFAVLAGHLVERAAQAGKTRRKVSRVLAACALWVVLTNVLQLDWFATFGAIVSFTLVGGLLMLTRRGTAFTAAGLAVVAVAVVAYPYWRWASSPRYSVVEAAADVSRRVRADAAEPCLLGNPAATLALENHLKTITSEYGDMRAKWRDCKPTHLLMSSTEYDKLQQRLPGLQEHLELVTQYTIYENYKGEREPGDRLYRVRSGYTP